MSTKSIQSELEADIVKRITNEVLGEIKAGDSKPTREELAKLVRERITDFVAEEQQKNMAAYANDDIKKRVAEEEFFDIDEDDEEDSEYEDDMEDDEGDDEDEEDKPTPGTPIAPKKKKPFLQEVGELYREEMLLAKECFMNAMDALKLTAKGSWLDKFLILMFLSIPALMGGMVTLIVVLVLLLLWQLAVILKILLKLLNGWQDDIKDAIKKLKLKLESNKYTNSFFKKVMITLGLYSLIMVNGTMYVVIGGVKIPLKSLENLNKTLANFVQKVNRGITSLLNGPANVALADLKKSNLKGKKNLEAKTKDNTKAKAPKSKKIDRAKPQKTTKKTAEKEVPGKGKEGASKDKKDIKPENPEQAKNRSAVNELEAKLKAPKSQIGQENISPEKLAEIATNRDLSDKIIDRVQAEGGGLGLLDLAMDMADKFQDARQTAREGVQNLHDMAMQQRDSMSEQPMPERIGPTIDPQAVELAQQNAIEARADYEAARNDLVQAGVDPREVERSLDDMDRTGESNPVKNPDMHEDILRQIDPQFDSRPPHEQDELVAKVAEMDHDRDDVRRHEEIAERARSGELDRDSIQREALIAEREGLAEAQQRLEAARTDPTLNEATRARTIKANQGVIREERAEVAKHQEKAQGQSAALGETRDVPDREEHSSPLKRVSTKDIDGGWMGAIASMSNNGREGSGGRSKG